MEGKSQCINWRTINSHHEQTKRIRDKLDKRSRRRELFQRHRLEEFSLHLMQPRMPDLPYVRRRSRQTEPQPVELEDGELSDEDVEMLPICRFHLANNCTLSSGCRLRHSGGTDMGNYVMFEPVKLPLLPMPDMYGTCMEGLSPVAGWMHETERESSFDRSLNNFRQLMLQSGHKVGGHLAKCGDNEQSLTELNDLDTDPYYTHPEQADERSPPRSPMNSSSPYYDDLLRWRGRNMLDWQSSSSSRRSSISSSSSSDYSSTTNSMSSSSPTTLCSDNPLKRKLYRRQKCRRWNTYLSSDSDSSSYRSSTPSSEQSYSSLDLNMDSINSNYPNSMRRIKTYAGPPSKSRKTL